MEKELVIPAGKGTKIYAQLRGSLKKSTIVLVHGLGGSMIEALHANAAKYFEKQGFSVLRFNLYDWRKGARRMRDCTLKIHGKDIDAVIAYLRKQGAKKIFVIGHSYGAPSILHSVKKDFNGVVFWDGSYLISDYFKKCKYVKEIDGRILDWGYDVVISEAMVKEANEVDALTLLRDLHVPIQILCAGKGSLMAGGKKMFAAANDPKMFRLIPGATHNFEEDGAEERLYKETVRWLKK